MKTLGIIAEYNPFHQGHQYHLNKSLEKTDSDAVITIMSGNFLQRGTPAIINKFSRAEIILQQGVDLVIQLPTSYTIRSAPNFAFGAVKLLDATNIVDYLSFGSESGNLKLLKQLAQLLLLEPAGLSQLIQKNLATGLSYPRAKSEAVISYLQKSNTEINIKQAKKALTSPNNILGIEYLKSLSRLNSSITPVTIKRVGSNYHGTNLQSFSSATAIRKKIQKNNRQNNLPETIKSHLPTNSFEILKREFKAGFGPIFFTSFTREILTLLRRMSLHKLKQYEDVTGGLENRIKEAAKGATTLEELIKLIKTKRYTRARIQRIITQILIDLTEDELEEFELANGPQYFRILGFTKRGRHLINKIKQKSNLPLITKVSDYYKSNYKTDNTLKKMLALDIKASNIYNLAYPELSNRKGGSDFFKHPIIMN